MPELDRVDSPVPSDFDAEQACLGSILLEGSEAAARAFAIVTPADFYRTYHRQIAEAAFACYQRREPVEIVTVAAELRRNRLLEEVGSGDYLTALVNEVPTAAHVQRYATIVAEKSVLRQAITDAHAIASQAQENPANVGTFLAEAQERLQRLYRDRVRGGSVHGPLDSYERDLTELWDDLQAPAGEISSARLGIPEVDRKIGGLEAERLTILKGDTKHGKSQLSRQLAIVTAQNFQQDESGRIVVFFILEEGERAWLRKSLAWLAEIDSMALLKRGWWKRYAANHPGAEDRLLTASSLWPTLPIYRTATVRDIAQIEATCRALRYEHEIGLVVVDYFQLIGGGSPDRRTEEQALTEKGNRLQSLADELACPVVCPAQVSYDPIGKRTITKGARGIEHNGSLVLEWRRDKTDQGDFRDSGKLACLIARNGPGFGPVSLETDRRCGRFYDLDTAARLRSVDYYAGQ